MRRNATLKGRCVRKEKEKKRKKRKEKKKREFRMKRMRQECNIEDRIILSMLK